MRLLVNGEPTEIADSSSVEKLVEQLGLSPTGIAVAVNRAVVPFSDRRQRLLQPSDQVEIIQAVGGG